MNSFPYPQPISFQYPILNQIDQTKYAAPNPALQLPIYGPQQDQYRNHSNLDDHFRNNNDQNQILNSSTQKNIISDNIKNDNFNSLIENNTKMNTIKKFGNEKNKTKICPAPIDIDHKTPITLNVLPVPKIMTVTPPQQQNCESQEKLNDFPCISAPPKIQAQMKLQLEKSAMHS